MTHVPEIGAVNRPHFSGAGFLYVCHAYLAPDSTASVLSASFYRHQSSSGATCQAINRR